MNHVRFDNDDDGDDSDDDGGEDDHDAVYIEIGDDTDNDNDAQDDDMEAMNIHFIMSRLSRQIAFVFAPVKEITLCYVSFSSDISDISDIHLKERGRKQYSSTTELQGFVEKSCVSIIRDDVMYRVSYFKGASL